MSRANRVQAELHRGDADQGSRAQSTPATEPATPSTAALLSTAASPSAGALPLTGLALGCADSTPLLPTTVPSVSAGLRRSAASADPLGGTEIPRDVVSALRRRSGGGQRLPATVESDLGSQLNLDLSGVRIHADAEAGQLAHAVGAKAFTSRTDVYFATGAYAPDTPSGQHLLAHELSHVADQASGADRGSGAVIGRADDPAEARADRTADRVVSALRRQAREPGQDFPTPQPRSDLSALRRSAVLRRTREDAKRAASGLYSADDESLLRTVHDTNLNHNYRLTMIRINNFELEPSDPDYIAIEHRNFPDLSVEAFAAERDRVVDVRQDYYFKYRSRPAMVPSVSQPSGPQPTQPLPATGSRVEQLAPSAPVAPTTEPTAEAPSALVGVRELRKEDFVVLETFHDGSTKPEKIQFKADHTIKVLKYGSKSDPEHIQTEILTQKLYEFAGIPSLPAELVQVDGVPAQLTDFIEKFDKPAIEDLRSSQDFWRHVGADMVFANWDLFKTANWMQIAGRMIRADLGGALDRRAQGSKKTAEEFGETVLEFDSMREKAESINPYSRLTGAEIADSIRGLAFQLTPDKLAAAFAAAGYPKDAAATLKATIVKRLANAVAWADKQYPLSSVVEAGPRAPQTVPELPVDERESFDPWEELASLGYDLSPHLMTLAPEERMIAMRESIAHSLVDAGPVGPEYPSGTTVKQLPKDAPAFDLLGIPAYVKSENPHEAPPLVGPEELLREDQYGSPEKRQAFVDALSRLRTGVLMRRMSAGEKAGFEAALAETDMDKVIDLLFRKGDRGEIVLSVNEPFVFERELKRRRGEKLTETEELEEAADEPKYMWIMEIPLTQGMLDFLQAYAYISAPPTAKPTAFMGSPNLKFEGAAGGVRDSGGIPNVVLKPQGFAKFWQAAQQLRFVLAKEHLWTQRSDNKDLLQAKILKERAAAIERARIAKAEKAKLPKEDPFEDGFGFSFDSGGDSDADDSLAS